ncbi:MAG: hypothetical protein GWN99_00615 [Gemmatimonadetes bacterium]|uniref:Outer membrane protein beta-barrel domain-containing protein n=1 Tax=Candidatus Kutchimonas denitrificans TaxID=3056748 RepID=A0AAE4Z4I2_9BACT|nr:hypothetical protein [Gemmatimonadota bacterium]NIR73610.1 hypothetical protein [Candidatus Kutchimonas denitrificans]NIR99569.1 hypothetical protein [Gemmatimonadota bacterium]NIT65189.1 hypothetical protein [Gemmatimonadota bacterium]NIV23722.1 hypothetical protein [Gemmatimonadota bacterium]
MNKLRRFAACAAALCVLTGSVQGQESETGEARRWAITLNIGWSPGEPPSGTLEEAMIAGDLDDVSPRTCILLVCSGDQPHPQTIGSQGIASAISLSYRANGWLELRGVWAGGGEYPETVGYGTGVGWLRLTPSLQTVALIPAFHIDGVIHVGAGPAMSLATLDDSEGERYRKIAPGAVLSAGLRLPPGTRFFIEFTGAYRYIAPVDFGSIELPDSSSDYLPDVRMDFSHAMLAVGLGVRF